METTLLITVIIFQIITFYKLKQIKKMALTAQETLEQFVTELTTAKDAIIARIDAIIAGGGDLTAQEVTDLLTPIKTDLQNIGTPPDPNA